MSAGPAAEDPEDAEVVAAEWDAARQRLSDLVQTLGPEEAARSVPACPDWSVLGLLSHMIGLDADVLADDEPDDHNPAWTQAQVDARADRTAAELVAEWAALAPDLVAYIRERDVRPLGDVIIHEQDLRGAVGRPGGTDSRGFAIIRDRMAGRLRTAVADAGLAPLGLLGDSWTWCSHDDVAPTDAPVRLRATDADLGRAVTSRRTADQIRSWVEAGDVEPYLACFATVGSLPDVPLTE